MKKDVLFVLLAIFLFFPMVSAVEFSAKENFSQGETFTARISGNFYQPISASDITFFKEHTRISLVPSVQKIDGDFYISAQLFGKAPDNYSIVISDAQYYSGPELVQSDLSKNFTITNDLADFTITPGFIMTGDDFFIQVQNLKDAKIIIKSKIINKSSSSSGSGTFFDSLFGIGNQETNENTTETIVKSGEIKKINFQKDNFIPLRLQILELSANDTSYQIPVYITSNDSVFGNGTSISGGENLQFESPELNISIPLNSKTTRSLYLANLGDSDLDEIELSLSDSLKPYVVFSSDNVSLNGNSSKKIDFQFFSDGNEQTIEGQIKAKTQNDFYAYISVTLIFAKNANASINAGDVTIPLCSELNGIVCAQGETCAGDSEVARDGVCCLATCEKPLGASLSWKIIGWTVVGIIAIVLILLFFRYKDAKNIPDLLNPRRN